MQEDNIIKVISLTDIAEFTMRREPTMEEIAILQSYGFSLIRSTWYPYPEYHFGRSYYGT